MTLITAGVSRWGIWAQSRHVCWAVVPSGLRVLEGGMQVLVGCRGRRSTVPCLPVPPTRALASSRPASLGQRVPAARESQPRQPRLGSDSSSPLPPRTGRGWFKGVHTGRGRAPGAPSGIGSPPRGAVHPDGSSSRAASWPGQTGARVESR